MSAELRPCPFCGREDAWAYGRMSDEQRAERVHAILYSTEDREDIAERIVALEDDNAKLREMLQRTWDAFHDATAHEFVTVKNELRELGVEVDG